jgi:cytochrome-b5 reductase
MLRENLFDAQVTYQTSQLVCVCGPPRFMESICGDAVMIEGKKQQGPLKGLLAEMGFTSDRVYKF